MTTDIWGQQPDLTKKPRKGIVGPKREVSAAVVKSPHTAESANVDTEQSKSAQHAGMALANEVQKGTVAFFEKQRRPKTATSEMSIARSLHPSAQNDEDDRKEG